MILLSLLALSGQTRDTTRTLNWGAFVDTYYAWDFNRPGAGGFDRAYTTQPARHDEFNVNLAHVEVRLAGPRTRGRLALQAGTSVQSNYAGEPQTGTVSGPDLARHIQEAVVGVRLASRLWIDGGIYLSHIGQESWISRDNPTYSRSLIADYSPYYEAGVKATWTASSKLTGQFHILNGWQNISETNTDKAIGMRLDYAATPNVALGYANFVGNEAPDTVASRLRVFNEVFGLVTSGPLNFWLTLDYGLQRRA
ncbi:MAG TPA: outer membrane beta-barrel protein, partial [Gemmatimonadales bacterium]|nr:outer membrane beta-barrel protein [Gemmatimonadales bacterium]